MKAPSAQTAAGGTLKVKINISEKDMNNTTLGHEKAAVSAAEAAALKGLNSQTVTVIGKTGNAMSPPVYFKVRTAGGQEVDKVLPRWFQDPNAPAPAAKPAKAGTTK